MKLWSHNFYWICETNLWLYASVYALFIHLPQPTSEAGSEILWAASLCFIVGIWLPGLFSAHLMDRIRRKHIYLYTLAGCLLCTLLIPYVDKIALLPVGQEFSFLQNGMPLIALRLIQGVCYGLALNTGSTLSVDITPSPRRDEANTLFMRLGRTGIGLGIIAAYLSGSFLGHTGIYYFSLAAGTLAFLSACLLHVPFYAPIRLPLCSTDRFLLPRVWPEMLNLFFIAAVPGTLAIPLLADISTYPEPAERILLWGVALAGFIVALFLQHHRKGMFPSALLPFFGLCAIIAGCIGILFPTQLIPFLCGIFLLTAGTELSAAGLLNLFVRIAKHSKRCTAANSYLLAWESGFAGGVAIGIGWGNDIDRIPLYCALIALLLFLFFTFRHYKRYKIH